MIRSRRCVGLFGCLLAVACSSKTANKPTLPPPAATASAEISEPPVTQATVVASPHVGVSPELAKKCRLQFSSRQQAPKFDFDQFELGHQGGHAPPRLAAAPRGRQPSSASDRRR